ncbi:hypothetical protein CAPN006_21830 [Capnocytophaga canimorsus]|uniref:hypothetical protein n=1 Tax=Capnocytophaga canimorsus TaxID=28188 RepID=UPI001AC280B5|nr:hypothetical protein [Capnocytophaga canimorsus]GIM57791.1 hypothetical protein CAPN006_21830 [Capnocytophaga canimorsus]
MAQINIKFQAYIPKSLGKPLLDYFKDDPKYKLLSNRIDFEQKLRELDSHGFHWFPEPGNFVSDYYCSTDNVDFHSIENTEHSVRLGFSTVFDLSRVGYFSLVDRIFRHTIGCNGTEGHQHSAFSHRARAYIYEKKLFLLPGVPHSTGQHEGVLEVSQPLKSDEKRLIWSVKNKQDLFYNNSIFKIQASAGYPFISSWITPNIDFSIEIRIVSYHKGGVYIDIKGNHNKFPAYELLLDNSILYKYCPDTSSFVYTFPNHYNLTGSKNFFVSKRL